MIMEFHKLQHTSFLYVCTNFVKQFLVPTCQRIILSSVVAAVGLNV